MTRAEKIALDIYPIKDSVSGVSILGDNNRDSFMFHRMIFAKGYQRAEKDLTLTWKDILSIVRISEQYKNNEWRDKQTFCEAVLKEFNKMRGL